MQQLKWAAFPAVSCLAPLTKGSFMIANAAKLTGFAFVLGGAVFFGAGCESKGPAQRAGENVDQGIQNVKDAVNPPGPVEKAGRTVDKALNK